MHDELKDKQFELELSWVGEHTDGYHQVVPAEIREQAESAAKAAMDEDSDSNAEDI